MFLAMSDVVKWYLKSTDNWIWATQYEFHFAIPVKEEGGNCCLVFHLGFLNKGFS